MKQGLIVATSIHTAACGGSQAWPTAQDRGSCLAGVQGFESLPPHYLTEQDLYSPISIRSEMPLLRPANPFPSSSFAASVLVCQNCQHCQGGRSDKLAKDAKAFSPYRPAHLGPGSISRRAQPRKRANARGSYSHTP